VSRNFGLEFHVNAKNSKSENLLAGPQQEVTVTLSSFDPWLTQHQKTRMGPFAVFFY